MVYTKRNDSPYADALMVEAVGLEWLRQSLPANKVAVPEVFSVDASQMQMTRIEASGACSETQAMALAEGLAIMHGKSQPYYGFEGDNYIGRNPQSNARHDNWGEFFCRERLWAQLRLMVEGTVRDGFAERLERNHDKLLNYLNEQCTQPVLLHGDLWSGNYLCDREQVWLIDPAVYFGDGEADIAMTEMFGGFPQAFYSAYNKARPLSEEYPRKREIYNLYHALNHLTLFGDAYRQACEKGFSTIEQL